MENALYSQAIKNYLCLQTDDKDLKAYLEILKVSSNRVPADLTKKLNKAIVHCNSTGIKYLLLSIQLGVTRFEENQNLLNKKIYFKLIKEFEKVPESCRKKVASALKLNKAYNYKGDLKAFRTWSQRYLENESDITFKTLINAISLSDEMASKESEAFYHSFQKALKHPDPFIILAGLNNAITSIKKTNLNRAVELSKELAYYAGIYGENHHVILILTGTLMKLAKQRQEYDSFYEVAYLVDHYYERIAKPIPSLKKMYQHLIRLARNDALVRKKKTLNKDEVSNTKTLRLFLKEKIGKINSFIKRHRLPHTTVYRVLSAESPVVLIKTLKSFIKALEIKPSFENPKEINYVLRIMRTEEVFEKHVETIHRMSNSELQKLLFTGIFITLPNEAVHYPKMFLLVKEREKFLNYIKRDIQRMKFINQCFKDDHDFYRGRRRLFDTFCEQLDEQAKHELLALYSFLRTNEDIEIFTRYFREYSRVSFVTLDFNVKTVLENRVSDPDYESIISFCKRLKLRELDGYLCTWFFESGERRRMMEICKRSLLNKGNFLFTAKNNAPKNRKVIEKQIYMLK